MSVDVALGGAAYLDLTFVGLEAVPEPGAERFAEDLLRTPGGSATVAIGAARLGLRAAMAFPLGRDADGRYLRELLDADGVLYPSRTIERTAVTAVMPVGGERAMASYLPAGDVRATDLAEHAPRSVVLALTDLHLAPEGATVYATAGDEDARRHAGQPPAALGGARALLVNAREARVLSGAGDAEAAAHALAAHVGTVVVTLGPDGALAVEDGRLERVPGVRVDAVDTTGAGDLFAAAYLWADLGGAPLAERLAWAVLYAALSVRVRTAAAGAHTAAALIQAGVDRGLVRPAWHLTQQQHQEEESR